MIKMTWLQLAHPLFQQAVNNVFDCPMLDAKTSYTAHRIMQGLSKVEKQIRDLRIEICGKFAKKDEDGKIMQDERGFITFDTPEQNREFEAEFTKIFQERTLELNTNKMDF